MENNLTNEEITKRLSWYEKRYGPYIEKRGLHNWKNLFRKPLLLEWIILIMLILTLFMAWAYGHDTQVCREIVKRDVLWFANLSQQSHFLNYSIPNFNATP